MRVLVTGASRVHRPHAWPSGSTADGHEVVPFSRRAGGDVTDPAAVERAAQGVDAVAHLVAILDGSDEQFEAVNAQGTRNVGRGGAGRRACAGSCT